MDGCAELFAGNTLSRHARGLHLNVAPSLLHCCHFTTVNVKPNPSSRDPPVSTVASSSSNYVVQEFAVVLHPKGMVTLFTTVTVVVKV